MNTAAHALTEPDAGAKSSRWGLLIFVLAAAAIPTCYYIGAKLSGENHFGQGLERSSSWPLFWGVQCLSFLGFILSPRLSVRSERREGLLMVLAFAAFVVDEVLSFAFIAFGMFPD